MNIRDALCPHYSDNLVEHCEKTGFFRKVDGIYKNYMDKVLNVDLENSFPCLECRGNGYCQQAVGHFDLEKVGCEYCDSTGIVDKETYEQKFYNPWKERYELEKKEHKLKIELADGIVGKLTQEELDFIKKNPYYLY